MPCVEACIDWSHRLLYAQLGLFLCADTGFPWHPILFNFRLGGGSLVLRVVIAEAETQKIAKKAESREDPEGFCILCGH